MNPSHHHHLQDPAQLSPAPGDTPSNENVTRLRFNQHSTVSSPRALSTAAPKYSMTRVHIPTWQNPVGQRAGVGEEVHGQGVSTLVQTNAMRFDKRSRVALGLNNKLRNR